MKRIWLWVMMFACFTSTVEAEILKVPLYKLAPVKTVDLRCIADEYILSIPIPERWEVEGATLKFSYMNSSGLLKGKSRLVVKLNDYPLEQINLDPVITEGTAEISLPARLLGPGYNKLSFNVSQHYTLRCEQPCAEDLWTTLKLDEASIEVVYGLKPVPLKLSSVSGFLFDPRIHPQGGVNIITEDSSPEMVTNAGIAASGIARRFDYRKVLFSISGDIMHEYDNVLIGKKEFVEDFLGQRGVKTGEINGPFLKIVHLPLGEGENDPYHALLVIAGLDLAQVKLAAETMAIISFPYPDTDEMTAMEFSLPDIPQYSGRLVLTSDKTYDFKTLKFGTHTFRGINPNPREITFRLPADFFVKQNMYADLNLYFSYGASMRSDSVLNISVNDRDVRAIPLDSSTGAIIEGYKISIPTYLFKAGTNTIRIEPVMVPSVTEECALIQTENLFLTMFETSTLYFPPMPHFVKLPRLELFFLNGFPFTRWPDGYETMLYLTQSDADTIASAFNLIGMITQKNGYPLFGMKIGFDQPLKWSGEIIVMGDIATIPEDLLNASPLKLAGEALVPYPVVQSWEGEEYMAFSKQISGLGRERGFMTEFQSPYKEGRTVLLITASSTGDLLKFSDAMLEPPVQAASRGDVVLVDLIPPNYRVSALEVGKKFFTGKSGKISKLDFYLHTYPYLYHASLAAVIIVLGLFIFYLLRRYRKKRLRGEKEAGSE